MNPRTLTLDEVKANEALLAQLKRLTTHDENPRSDMWIFLHGELTPFRWATILEEEGVVVGWAAIYGIFLARLYADVFVGREHRGRGVGRALVDAVLTAPIVVREPHDPDPNWWGQAVFSDVPFYRHVTKVTDDQAIVRDGVALIRVPRTQTVSATRSG